MNTELQSEERKEALAVEADGRISGSAHWNDWMYIADGFAVGVAKAMRAANTNRPYGKAYTRLFGDWLDERPWTKRYDKGTRSNLLWCADHRSEIEEWRSEMKPEERNKLNHPTNFRRKYEAAHRVKDPEEPQRETAKDNLLRENEELLGKVRDLEGQLEERGEGSVIEDTLSALLRKDAKTIGATIVRQLIGDGRFDLVWEIRATFDREVTAHQNSEWKKAKEAGMKAIENKAKNRAKKPKVAEADMVRDVVEHVVREGRRAAKADREADDEAGGYAPGALDQIARDLRAAAKRKSKAAKQAAE
jgi:hypothetical protein